LADFKTLPLTVKDLQNNNELTLSTPFMTLVTMTTLAVKGLSKYAPFMIYLEPSS